MLGAGLLDELVDCRAVLLRDREDRETLVGHLRVQLVQVNHLGLAGASPGAEELDEHDSAAQRLEIDRLRVDELLALKVGGAITHAEDHARVNGGGNG